MLQSRVMQFVYGNVCGVVAFYAGVTHNLPLALIGFLGACAAGLLAAEGDLRERNRAQG